MRIFVNQLWLSICVHFCCSAAVMLPPCAHNPKCLVRLKKKVILFLHICDLSSFTNRFPSWTRKDEDKSVRWRMKYRNAVMVTGVVYSHKKKPRLPLMWGLWTTIDSLAVGANRGDQRLRHRDYTGPKPWPILLAQNLWQTTVASPVHTLLDRKQMTRKQKRYSGWAVICGLLCKPENGAWQRFFPRIVAKVTKKFFNAVGIVSYVCVVKSNITLPSLIWRNCLVCRKSVNLQRAGKYFFWMFLAPPLTTKTTGFLFFYSLSRFSTSNGAGRSVIKFLTRASVSFYIRV